MTTRVPPRMIGVGAGESIQAAINALPAHQLDELAQMADG